IYTDKQHFAGVKNELDNLKYNLIKADLEFIADNQIKLNDEDQKKLENLIQALEDDEDVDMVWNNAS
ncbi:MAG: YebC/PmpR family DNA-binding transcriptional regulator, partial [Candidatus Absconditabacterales bacterium]